MLSIAELQRALAIAHAEIKVARKENELKNEQIALLTLKLDSLEHAKTPTHRNLLCDFSRLEAKQLREENIFLKSELTLAQLKIHELEQQLREEKEIVEQLRKLLEEELAKESRNENVTSDEWIDFLSLQLKTMRGELEDERKQNKMLWTENLKNSMESAREKTRMESELNKAKEEATFHQQEIVRVIQEEREKTQKRERLIHLGAQIMKEHRADHRAKMLQLTNELEGIKEMNTRNETELEYWRNKPTSESVDLEEQDEDRAELPEWA
uniref:Uncharacterized protein n=1 Tax=Caenorhabditis japonica TaxID=281687 RepID=A0A8R1DUX2_CAEJA